MSDDQTCETCHFVDFDSSENPCVECKSASKYVKAHSTTPPTFTEGKDGAAPKDVSGKPEPTLLPMDLLIEFVEPAYQEGVQKYVRESWRRGFNVTDLIDAMFRHVNKFMSGEDFDPEAADYGVKKHHLAAAVFCCLSAMHTCKYHPHLDNRFNLKTGKFFNE